MSFRPHPKMARVDPANPSAWGTCDRCGQIGNLRDFVWDREWAGPKIINKRFLVCRRCDTAPNPQLQTIILPPDPDPIFNARPEPYALDELPAIRVTMSGHPRVVLQPPRPRGAFRTLMGNASLQTSP